MRIAVPDLISNSYFPAIAAVELGFFAEEGLDMQLDLLFPVPQTMAALRDGDLDFVAGAAHATLMAFPAWQGARLLMALAQRTYWLLVLRADLHATRGDLSVVKGRRIGAAPGVDVSLKRLLVEAGIDPELTGCRSGRCRAPRAPACLLVLRAAQALAEGKTRWFLGQCHGRRDCRTPGDWHSRPGCAPRQRSTRFVVLYLSRPGDHRKTSA